MALIRFLGLSLLGCSVVMSAERLAPAQHPAFYASTDLVTIDTLVQRRGRPVTGLTASDFELLDNGVRQQITVEASEAVPVDVTMVFDEWWYAVGGGGRIGSDLRQVADRLRPFDRLRVIVYATDVREVLPMQHPSGWSKAGLPELTARTGTASLAATGRMSRDGEDLLADPGLGSQSLSEAVLLALARPSEAGRRHLVIVMTHGVFEWGLRSIRYSLSAIAARSDAMLHVGLFRCRICLGAVPPAALFLQKDLQAAAAATGGEVRLAPDALTAFKGIFEDLRRSYLLRYTATGVSPAGWHSVVVTTPKFPGYTIRARSGYLGR